MNFDDAYDAIYALVAAALTDHKELTDNDLIEGNSSKQLERGWCIKWEDADNTERELDCDFSVRQYVTITNTLIDRGSDEDREARKKAEKAILANMIKIVKAVEISPQLDGDVELLKFERHNGISRIFGEEQQEYLMIQSTFSIEIFKPRGA